MSQNGRTLGIDIGGVIRYQPDPTSEERIQVPGAFEAIRRLVDGRFGEWVFIVSKRKPERIPEVLAWLERHGFWALTGIRAANVHFCTKRHEKSPICARLGITHFVDNRFDVLGYLGTVPHRYLLRYDPQEAPESAYFRPCVSLETSSWDAIVADILAQ